jgi:hypothetical protein
VIGFEPHSEHPQLEKMGKVCIFCVPTLLEEGLFDPTSFSYLPKVCPRVRATEFIEKARVFKVLFDTFILH